MWMWTWLACFAGTVAEPDLGAPVAPVVVSPEPEPDLPVHPSDAWLHVDQPVAQGFVAPRDGEGSWRAPATGTVVRAEPGLVELEHVFYEDHHRRRVRSRLPVGSPEG